EARAWSGDASRETRVEIVLEGENAQVTQLAHWPAADVVQPAPPASLIDFAPGQEAQRAAPNAEFAPPALPNEELRFEAPVAEIVDREGAQEPAEIEEAAQEPVQREEREASQEETLPSHGVARWLARLGQ